MKCKVFGSVFLVGMISVRLIGAPSPGSFDEQMNKIHQSIKIDSLTVKFEQTAFRKLRSKTVRFWGSARFFAPNQFRWTIDKPIKQEWIYNGEMLWNYFPEEHRSVKYSTADRKWAELNELVHIVLNLRQLKERYIIEEIKQEKDTATIQLQPKTKDSDIRGVLIRVNTQKKYVAMVRLNFDNGNYTEFSFTDPDFKKIEPGVFSEPVASHRPGPAESSPPI